MEDLSLTEELSLDAQEKKILEVIQKCGQERLTVDLIASKSGLPVTTICEKINNPVFKELYKEAMKQSLLLESPAILHTFTEQAKQGVFKQGKLILELAGVHQDKQRIEMDANLKLAENPFKTDEERLDWITGVLNKLKEVY